MDRSVIAPDNLKEKNLIKLPNVGSETPLDFNKKADNKTCQILISPKSGEQVKEILKDIIINYGNEFIESIKNIVDTYEANPKKNINIAGKNPIDLAFENIDNIRKEIKKANNVFKEKVKGRINVKNKQPIRCEVFIKTKETNEILPVKNAYINYIDPFNRKINISFTGSKSVVDINMDQLCIGTLAVPPDTFQQEPDNDTAAAAGTDQFDNNLQDTAAAAGTEQDVAAAAGLAGGRRKSKKQRIIKLKKIYTKPNEDELSYCD